MKQRQLGRSGLRVSSIGLGTRTWGPGMTEESSVGVLSTFRDAGGTLIDANFSAHNGHAVSLLGAALSSSDRESVVLSAAGGVRPEAPVGSRVDCSRKALLSVLDKTLAALGTDYVDIFSAEYWDEFTPPHEVADTLEYIVRSGRARYAGVRGYSSWQVAVTHSPALIATQSEYNLLDRSAEQELLPACQFLGVGFISSSTLAHGILTGKYRGGAAPTDAEVHSRLDQRSARIVEALGTAAEGLGISPATGALAWALARPGVSSTLVSVSDPMQFADILPAVTTALPTAIVAALDDISAL